MPSCGRLSSPARSTSAVSNDKLTDIRGCARGMTSPRHAKGIVGQPGGYQRSGWNRPGMAGWARGDPAGVPGGAPRCETVRQCTLIVPCQAPACIERGPDPRIVIGLWPQSEDVGQQDDQVRNALGSYDFTAHLCTGIGTQSYKLLVIPSSCYNAAVICYSAVQN